MPEVGLILLAAGGSRRLGQPKQLLVFQGQTLLRRAAEAAAASVCRPVVVVLGAQAERMREELAGLSVRSVVNPDWEQGLASSLRMGLAAIRDEDVAGVVVALCDQPLLTGDVLDALVTSWSESASPVAASEYGGTQGVPALFARALFPDLAALTGTEGAKKILLHHAAEVTRVPFPDGLVDIDTPEDWGKIAPSG